MTPLRQSMIEAMQLRGFSPRTHESYLHSVELLARYFYRSPDQLSVGDIQAYLKHVVIDQKLSPSTCRLRLNGIRFLFVEVLDRAFDVGELNLPKRPQRIPELLNRKEVRAIIENPQNLKHRTLLMTCYGCGLRLSELVHIKAIGSPTGDFHPISSCPCWAYTIKSSGRLKASYLLLSQKPCHF
ncbi:MAG TPA: hypothetical protein ENK06_04135 [Gammaproteobacteria bacterium]|nr:hypothetical protein [Gammaproteobacteria bacterium]